MQKWKVNQKNGDIKISPKNYCLSTVIQESNLWRLKYGRTEVFKIGKLGGKSILCQEGGKTRNK